MRRLAFSGCLEGLDRVLLTQLQRSYLTSAIDTKAPPRLTDLCKLVQKIMEGQEPDYIRRRRIRGVIRKMEVNYIHWLSECKPRECLMLLTSLAGASRHLKSYRTATIANHQHDEEWSGASPYFSQEFNDWLCVLLERSAHHASRADEWISLLWVAAELELADTQTLQHLSRQLTSQEYTASASPNDLVCVFRLISLLVKRCRMPVPPLDHLLCRLPTTRLDSRQSLNVLSSIIRLRERHSVEVVRSVSRHAAEHVATYTKKDVIYALEAIALLNCCHESFAVAVLDRCTALHADFQPKELGSVCKYVAMLSSSRLNKDMLLLCAKELRRLLPALLSRTEQLLGRFSLRDARCVLYCLEQHKVHHSVVFSRLTPLALES